MTYQSITFHGYPGNPCRRVGLLLLPDPRFGNICRPAERHCWKRSGSITMHRNRPALRRSQVPGCHRRPESQSAAALMPEKTVERRYIATNTHKPHMPNSMARRFISSFSFLLWQRWDGKMVGKFASEKSGILKDYKVYASYLYPPSMGELNRYFLNNYFI